MRALSADRKASAVAETLVGTNLHLALDVLAGLTAKIAFDLQVLFDVGTDLGDFSVGQVADSSDWVDADCLAQLLAGRKANSEDVREADLHLLVAWNIDAGYTCHGVSPASAYVGGWCR